MRERERKREREREREGERERVLQYTMTTTYQNLLDKCEVHGSFVSLLV